MGRFDSPIVSSKGRFDESTLIEDKDEDTTPGFFKSFFSGIVSGAIKIPEGVVSLGASLIDMGFDTDAATEVEEFFDKINPFEEIAEKSLTGKSLTGNGH